MARQRKRKEPLLLGYSTNVHPGETLEQVYDFLREFTIPIGRRVFGPPGEQCPAIPTPHGPAQRTSRSDGRHGERADSKTQSAVQAGLELRLGIGSARELGTQRARREFREFLDESGLVLFSVNAFPLLDFHAKRVKEQVYKPSWLEADRGRWTSRIARIVAELSPPDIEPSISTLGGCYRREAHDDRSFRKFAAVAAKCLETFAELEREGRPMCLAFEPEPETTFETCQDVITFFEEYLLPRAFETWKRFGNRSRIEETLRRVFAVNYDTCHLSVLFEDQIRNLRSLEKAGIRLGKLHITNAVSLRSPHRSPAAYQDFRGMNEPRYFHQFCGVDARGRVTWRDLDLDRLPRRLDRSRDPDVAELRSHFHVPLYLRKFRRLYTTHEETTAAIDEVVRRGTCRHLVLETYTWPLLTGRDDWRGKLTRGIAREFRWLLAVLEQNGKTR